MPDRAPAPPSFSPEALARVLSQDLHLAADARLRIAYSGGLDSHVLLHAAARLRERGAWTVSAIHIDHGLRPESIAWAEHCRAVCTGLGVALEVERVRVEGIRERGLEDAARRARYDALARLLAADEVLLTAHHRDDQAETVLLQLLRAAGPHGLAAMPPLAPSGGAGSRGRCSASRARRCARMPNGRASPGSRTRATGKAASRAISCARRCCRC